MKILVVHGPNLNLLGERRPDQYGTQTLDQVDEAIRVEATCLGASVDCVQSNHEGEIVELIQRCREYDGVILNPGGYAHTSVAIRDAVEACAKPVIEVHLSNIHGRDAFRQRSVIAGVCRGQIAGLGAESYLAALYVLARRAQQGT